MLRALGPHATAAVRSTLAPLLHYHPANPTGVYTLMLGQRAHRAVAKRLLLAFTQQWDAGFSTYPYRMAFTTCTVDGKVGGWASGQPGGFISHPYRMAHDLHHMHHQREGGAATDGRGGGVPHSL